jgi:hypothetical protein
MALLTEKGFGNGKYYSYASFCLYEFFLKVPTIVEIKYSR